MRKVLIGLFILLFVLAAVVFIGPSLVNWNDYKAEIAEAVEAQTGRQLSIDGDISLSLLPTPALSVKDVRLANIEGAENPDMASLRSLDVLVALAPLLEGRIQVRSLELVEPTIRLEVLPDGRRNWAFTPQETPAAQSEESSSGGFGGDIRFDRIAISGGTLIYRDAAAGREERIENLDARITAQTLEGPFSLSGSASFRDIAFGFDGGTGRLAAQGGMPVNLAVTLDDAEAELRFNGTVDQSTAPASVAGILVVKGQDPGDLAASLGAPGALPEAVSGPFQIESDIAYGEDRLDLSSLSIVLADLRADGRAGIALGGETPEAELTLRVSQLNLDALLPEQESESEEDAGAATDGAGFALPQGIGAKLDLTVETMIYKAQVVRNSVLRGRLSDGVLQLEEASALLPGGSRVALDGQVTQAEAGPRFDGALQAESDNLRTLLTWMEVELEGISAERLRRASVTTQVVATPKQIDLTGIDAMLDVSKITGGLAVALGKRPSFGAGITIDKINLDAYLGGGAPGSGDDGESEGEAANPLAGFDANLDLRAGQVVYQGQTLYDLHLDATVQNGGMTIRQARVGNLANSRASLTGRLEGLPAAPALTGGSLDVEVNDPAAVSRVLGLPADGPLVRLGPFSAQGDVNGSLQGFTLDGSIDARPVAGQLAGSFSGLPLEPQVENGRFDLTIEDPAALAAVAGAGDPDGTLARLGPVTLKGTASGGLQALTLDAAAGLQGGSFALSGEASDLTATPSFDLALDARHPNLAQLVAILAPGQAVPQDAGGLDLKAQVTGSPQRLSISGIDGSIGLAEIAGEVIYDQGAARPLLTANLTAGELPLAAFGLAGAGGEGSGTPAPNDGERWSSEPIDTGPLRRFDADIDLKADALVHQDWRLENAVVLAKLRDGVLTLEQLDGDLFGGKVALAGTVTAQQDIAADLSVTADQVDTARLASVLGGVDRVSGPLSFSADVTTRGVSQRELVDNLNGGGVIDGKLQARASAEEKGLAVLLGFLGSQVKEVQGIADAAFLILNAFAGEAATLSGTLDIQNGVIRTDDGRLEGQGAFALLRGMAANLPDWQIDFATELFQNADTQNPFVTLGLIGPLDDPNTKLGGLAMQPGGQQGIQGMLQSLTGQGGQAEGEEGGQQGLQGVIQGLTGGVLGTQQAAPQEGEQPAEAQPQQGLQEGLGGVIQGITGGVLGGQAAPESEAAAPEPGEAPGPEGDEIQPLTEAVEGEAGAQPAEEAASEAETPPQETVEGVVVPTPRPAALEGQAPPAEEPVAEQPATEEPATEEPATEEPAAEEAPPVETAEPQQEEQPLEAQPQTQQQPQAQEPQAQEPSGQQQLNKLLEGLGVRQPEPEEQPASDGGWQEPSQQQNQGTNTQDRTTDSTTQDQTRQSEEVEQQDQQNQQPGANFIRNILKGGKKE